VSISGRHLNLQDWKKGKQGEQAHLEIKELEKEKDFIDQGVSSEEIASPRSSTSSTIPN